jgi:methionine synthase II (cobalamin-independent)
LILGQEIMTGAIRTVMVGSWPIPFGQRLMLKNYYLNLISDADAYSTLQRAARVSMDEQIACGVDQIMGGEVFAPDFYHHIPPRLAGLETLQARDTAKGYAGVGQYRVVERITAPIGTGHAIAYRRESAIEPKLGKAAVPSPLTIGGGFVNEASRDHLADMIDIVFLEIADMVAAGATEIQLDAPSEAVGLVSGTKAVSELVELIAGPLEAARSDTGGQVITRTVHFCLGDISRQTATEDQNLKNLVPLLQALEGTVDRVHLECSYPGQWQDISVLNEVPSSMEIIAGIADVKSTNPAASVDVLSSKIQALLDIIPAERLLVSTSCGCGRVPHDEAIRLVRNLVKAARAE